MIRSILHKFVSHLDNTPHWYLHIRRIIGQILEERHTLHTAILLEIFRKEPTRLQIDTHGAKDNSKVVLVIILHALVRLTLLHQPSLPTNLRRNFVVWETGRTEDGDLLATSDGVHGVDGADPGRDHLFGVDAGVGVDGGAVDVEVVFRHHFGAFVDGVSGAVEDAA